MSTYVSKPLFGLEYVVMCILRTYVFVRISDMSKNLPSDSIRTNITVSTVIWENIRISYGEVAT